MNVLNKEPGLVAPTIAPAQANSAPRREPDHLGYVDALRGLAFLAVLFYHCVMSIHNLPTWLSAIAVKGNYGVQLFYVASAFTLFLSLRQRSSRDERPVLFFFVRRFFRIAPMFWAAIIFYLLRDGLGPRSTAPLGLGVPHVLTTALFLHGWYPTTINSVVPGGWSIAVEMVFYLMVPFFFHHVRSLKKMAIIFVVLLVVSRIATWACRTWLLGSMGPTFADCVNEFGYYWLPAQMPVFCMGFMLYFLIESPTMRSLAKSSAKKLWANLGLVGAALLFGVLTVTGLPLGFIGFAAVGVVMALSLALHENRLLVNRLTLYAGKVSYSGYLCHFFVLDLVKNLGIWNSPRLPVPPVVQYFLFSSLGVIGTLLVSSATYRWIEVPGRNLGRALIQRLKSAPVAQKAGAFAPSEPQP